MWSAVVDLANLISVASNGSLTLHAFRPEHFRPDVHAATYKCSAGNSIGRILSTPVRVRAGIINHRWWLAIRTKRYSRLLGCNKSIIYLHRTIIVRVKLCLLPCFILSFVNIYLYMIVMLPPFEATVENPRARRGATAVFRCNVPESVRDYVTITSWIQDNRYDIFLTSSQGEFDYSTLSEIKTTKLAISILKPKACSHMINGNVIKEAMG